MNPQRPDVPHKSRSQMRPARKVRKPKKLPRQARRTMKRLYADAKRRRKNQAEIEERMFMPAPPNDLTKSLEKAQEEVYGRMFSAMSAKKPKPHKSKKPSALAFEKPLYEYAHDIPELADSMHVKPRVKKDAPPSERTLELFRDALRKKEKWHDRMFDPPVKVTFTEVMQQVKKAHVDQVVHFAQARRPSMHTPRQESTLTLDKTFSAKEEREQEEERQRKLEKAQRKKQELQKRMSMKKDYEQTIYDPEAQRMVPERTRQKLEAPADVFEAKKLRHTQVKLKPAMPTFEEVNGRRASQDIVISPNSERLKKLHDDGTIHKKKWDARPFDGPVQVKHSEIMDQVKKEIDNSQKTPKKPEPHYPRQVSTLELDDCWSAKLEKEQKIERERKRQAMLVQKKKNEDRLRAQKALHKAEYNPDSPRKIPDATLKKIQSPRDIFEDKKLAQFKDNSKPDSPRNARRASALGREMDRKHQQLTKPELRVKLEEDQKKRAAASPRGGGGAIRGMNVTMTVMKAVSKFKKGGKRASLSAEGKK